MLLDDVRLAVFHAFEPVRDMEPVAHLLRPRVDEIELGRVRKPAGDQRRGVFGAGALAEAWRDERSKLDTARKARRDRGRVLSGDGLHKPGPDRGHHAVSLSLTGTGWATLSSRPGDPIQWRSTDA